ncbi:MAG TPA: hypothetical protein PLQ97_06645 [Myxococcota bacterium]|nr:hypothetical protein [Myxococcota bacterium]HQK50620.1 hypothetical protein [Myxococcota bacterium]
MTTRCLVTTIALPWVLAAGCGSGNPDPCAPCDSCPRCPDICAAEDLPGDAIIDMVPDGPPAMDPGDIANTDLGDEGPTGPTWWTAEATRTIDDLRFLTVKDPVSGQMRPIFGLGVHPSYIGAWDGVSGPGQCRIDPDTGQVIGHVDNGIENLHAAAAAGANFAYTWDYVRDPDFLAVDPPLHGIWHPEHGSLGPGQEAIPIMVCPYGEEDMSDNKARRIAEMAADFEDFKARRGRWSPENAPTLPPFEDLPWFCWHPTFRMIGGGDGYDDYLQDSVADAFAKTTNLLIGDTYTYVCNRFEGGSLDAILYGQKGEQGECYDDWLAWNDPDHRRSFTAGWELAHSLRRRAHPDAVVWMWMQGYAFDDGIGTGVCWSGQPSDSWASGPFPTQRYLRKEILSTIAAGATGIIFFGYGYNREITAVRMRSILRALSLPEVYGPALMSPRLDLGMDTTFVGEEGRAHLLVKWDASTRAAYVLGANPGALPTPIDLPFPWTLSRAEVLDWNRPGFQETAEEMPIVLDDRTLRFVAPADEGFIIRVTPLFPE